MSKSQNISDYQGDTWVIDLFGLTLAGAPVDLTGVTVEGAIAGIPISSYQLLPEPSVPVRVIVDATATGAATPTSTYVASRITLIFPSTQEKSIVFGFQVLARP